MRPGITIAKFTRQILCQISLFHKSFIQFWVSPLLPLTVVSRFESLGGTALSCVQRSLTSIGHICALSKKGWHDTLRHTKPWCLALLRSITESALATHLRIHGAHSHYAVLVASLQFFKHFCWLVIGAKIELYFGAFWLGVI